MSSFGEKRRYEDHVTADYRQSFQRDRDRVLYSSAFRRLAGVTQVAAVSEQRVLHNRLTHSLKVAQLGRRIAQRISAADPEVAEAIEVSPDVVETAGLAHDLGHPPFGHIAETVLDKKMKSTSSFEGFEGNAQTFRIVTKLARRRKSHRGLDLTRASLNAILKYPRTRFDEQGQAGRWTDRSRGDKWGTYASDLAEFEWVRERSTPYVRCPNAVIMDWADDITYATHDIEDYFRAGMIPLHDLGRDRDELVEHGRRRLKTKHRGFEPHLFAVAMDRVLDRMNGQERAPHWETRENRAWLNEVTSKNITDMVEAVHVHDDDPYVHIDEEAQYAVEALKELTWFYVIDRPRLAMMQEGQKRIIGSLYDQLVECLEKDPSSRRLPVMLRELHEDAESDLSADRSACSARAATDYICLLTEGQAVDLGERMSGTTRNSMFGAWFH